MDNDAEEASALLLEEDAARVENSAMSDLQSTRSGTLEPEGQRGQRGSMVDLVFATSLWRFTRGPGHQTSPWWMWWYESIC